MLRLALWLTRVTGLIVVGLLTFLERATARGAVATHVVTYSVLCAGIAVWAVAEFRSRPIARMNRMVLTAAVATVTAAACVGAAVGGGGQFMIAFAGAAMLTAADELTVQSTVTIGALGVLCIEVTGIVFGQSVAGLLGFPLVMVVGALIGRNRAALRVQTEQTRQLLAQHELLRSEQRRADVLDERARLAREIHDVLAHSLGALGIQLQTVKALFTVHDDPERALDALATAQRMASEGLTETRRAVHALRTGSRPLHEEIARTAAEHAERHRIVVHCDTSGAPVPLPPEVIVAMLRTAQESMVNAVKHAPGADIAVQLDYLEDGLRLTVANPLQANGAGAGGETPSLQTANAGYGLTGMSERLRLLHGSLQAGPRGGRWVVEAQIPLTPAPATLETQKDDR
ncbi:MAG TPA: histidine kinase [Actinocrinis sp.]|jgi:signal transduction histidine kinase